VVRGVALCDVRLPIRVVGSSMNNGELEARPYHSWAFRAYMERLRSAQTHPNQVERARLYRRAWLQLYPESPEMTAYNNKQRNN